MNTIGGRSYSNRKPETDKMVQFLDPETERKLLPRNSENGSSRSLGPETEKMVQFQDQKTDRKLLFLVPEIIKMDQQYFLTNKLTK